MSKCDFCGMAITQGTLYETTRHTFTPDVDIKIHVTVGPTDGYEEWVACDECNFLIINDVKDWSPMLDRLMTNDKFTKNAYTERQLRRITVAMHTNFRINRNTTPLRIWYANS